MRMGLRTVCGANLRSLSGVLRPRDTLDREAASVASVIAGRMSTTMSHYDLRSDSGSDSLPFSHSTMQVTPGV